MARFQAVFVRWPQTGGPTLSSRFSSWDIAHYLRLSQDGYEVDSPSCAFYPMWPAAIRLGTVMTGNRPVLAAMLLANVLSLAGLWLLFRLIERHRGAVVSRDALILLLAFPGALFFSFPYTESLYLVILMLFFWGLELQRWFWAGLAGFLLPLTRPVGIFIVLPLGWFLFEQWRSAALVSGTAQGIHSQKGTKATKSLRYLRELLFIRSGTGVLPADFDAHGRDAHAASRCTSHWLLLLCPLLGYATYFVTMHAWTGNAFEGFEAQKAYPNSPSISNILNVAGFLNSLVNLHTVDGMLDAALDRGFFVLFLALLPAVWKLNRTWFWYTLPTGLIPALSNYFLSYRRFIMLCFPLFIVLAQLLAKGPRWMFWYYVILLAAMQAWAVLRFVNFNWAG
ncbi:MAG: hypothetical protein KJ070_22925 [Verrucomicrobia bacterium]|nr:hypothetical protein [Verrucomicrobiota bacterium]